jgi:hypothetical protein
MEVHTQSLFELALLQVRMPDLEILVDLKRIPAKLLRRAEQQVTGDDPRPAKDGSHAACVTRPARGGNAFAR